MKLKGKNKITWKPLSEIEKRPRDDPNLVSEAESRSHDDAQHSERIVRDKQESRTSPPHTDRRKSTGQKERRSHTERRKSTGQKEKRSHTELIECTGQKERRYLEAPPSSSLEKQLESLENLAQTVSSLLENSSSMDMEENIHWNKKTYENGDVYNGEFKNSIKDGRGSYTAVAGWSYDGDWRNDKKHGVGLYRNKNGSLYEGEWTKGTKNGWGRYTRRNGSVYEGEWKDDKIDGQARMTRKDGSSYVGEWKNDKPHGQGKYRFSDDSVYKGKWKNGMRHGHGVYTKDGSIFVGEWKDGLKHGSGRIHHNGSLVEEHVDGQNTDREEWEENMKYSQRKCFQEKVTKKRDSFRCVPDSFLSMGLCRNSCAVASSTMEEDEDSAYRLLESSPVSRAGRVIINADRQSF